MNMSSDNEDQDQPACTCRLILVFNVHLYHKDHYPRMHGSFAFLSHKYKVSQPFSHHEILLVVFSMGQLRGSICLIV